MLETAIITFREGLEMFLIIAIMLAYLTKTGRSHLREPVYWGAAVAGIISATTGLHIAEMAQAPAMEGVLALTAGVLVASMTYVVMKGAKNIRQTINKNLEEQASLEGNGAVIGVFLFTVLMIIREGMESALMLGAVSGTINSGDLIVGALLGFAAVGAVGYLWVRQSEKIHLRVFMQATGLFLMIFCVHLFAYGFHELTEGALIPGIDNLYWHTLSEPLEPGEPIGMAIMVAMVAVPCAWLLISYLRHRLLATPVTQGAE